jgi:hypothetical protein
MESHQVVENIDVISAKAIMFLILIDLDLSESPEM